MGPYDAQFLDLRKNPELMKSISEFAERFILLHDRSPYTSEIAEALGVAKSTVYRYLVEMDERGMLQYYTRAQVAQMLKNYMSNT